MTDEHDPKPRTADEMFDEAGIPLHVRDVAELAMMVGKLCAVVEAVIAQTGEPIRVSVERMVEVMHMGTDTTKPEDMVMVVDSLSEEEPSVYEFRLATLEERLDVYRKVALRNMGARRN